MRIAIVSDYIDPMNWGGAARVACDQARALKELGHEILLVAASSHSCTIDTVQHVQWIEKGGLIKLAQLFYYLFNSIKQFKPDLVILHQPLSGRFVQKLFPHLKTHYFFHSSWVDEVLSLGNKRGISIKARLEKHVVSQAKSVFVTSPFTRSVLQKIDDHVAKNAIENPLGIWSPPYGVVQNEMQEIKKRYHIDQDKKVIVIFRRLIPRTGVQLFLESLTTLDHVSVFVGGSGEQEPELKKITVDLDLEDKVNFLGYISDEQKIELLKIADASIVPSLELEGFGLSTLEAMACGCPVVATPVGNNIDLVESCQGGVIAKEVSAQALAEATKVCMNISWDRQELSEKVISRFNWHTHCEKLLC